MLSLAAIPHINVPSPKKTLEKRRPLRREKMSVRRPARGWQAALAIR
jgi:hypothetical protein